MHSALNSTAADKCGDCGLMMADWRAVVTAAAVNFLIGRGLRRKMIPRRLRLRNRVQFTTLTSASLAWTLARKDKPSALPSPFQPCFLHKVLGRPVRGTVGGNQNSRNTRVDSFCSVMSTA